MKVICTLSYPSCDHIGINPLYDDFISGVTYEAKWYGSPTPINNRDIFIKRFWVVQKEGYSHRSWGSGCITFLEDDFNTYFMTLSESRRRKILKLNRL